MHKLNLSLDVTRLLWKISGVSLVLLIILISLRV